ncbi:S41 family peptidase [Ichthyenterobacterium magnum]|uniref:Peptidase S41-like protein n=1 Tax=Ichthyenterobacterium magnum TaxID=1230530 RepID=A0A420DL65_9FLAO|nr:S41 family peptidase [Ichthyenterobacterium magnum]RKE94983.1 peptidase S41-like protein [Ichthyenterobacterium magnum]
MRILKISLLAIIIFSLTSCFEDNDDNTISAVEISDFVWKGMNSVYLYKADVPDLFNDRFTTNDDYNDYLNGFSGPEDLFESLIYEPETVDRFSVLVPDYIALENFLTGSTKTNGLHLEFYFSPESQNNVFGIVRMVLNGSPADDLGLERGQVFDAVNGVSLTNDNLNSLLNQDTYTLNLANYNNNGTPQIDDDTIESSDTEITLTKVLFTENPVHRTKIIDVDGENVGYLMYNRFLSDFDTQLNNAFGEFVASNIQHLVLDLRYNGGGSVNTASLLGSMIAGQENGNVFSKLVYNEDQQASNRNFNFTNTFNNIAINSLNNLEKIYVLTSARSASASELIINSLRPYIEVIQIGDTTVGKTQASITIYDSPDFGRANANPNHTYALQPLVANSINVDDLEVPPTGLVPNIQIIESPLNYGTFGDINEPLLAAAILDIMGAGRMPYYQNSSLMPINSKIDTNGFENEMYIENDEEHPFLKFN